MATIVLFTLFYQLPPFPEKHQFHLQVLNERNSKSDKGLVELVNINTLSVPSNNVKRIPVNQLVLADGWRGSNNGYGLIGLPGAEMRYERYMQAGLTLTFATGPSAGIVSIDWDGQTQTIDLFYEHSDELTINLTPGFDLNRALLTHRILAFGAMLADFWLVTLVIFSFSMIAIRWVQGQTVSLRNPLLLAGIAGSILLLQIGAMAINRPVEFNNDPLEAAVREAIQRPRGEIYDRHLRTMASLDASNRGITNLDGIEWMPNLQELNLRGNRISDISRLSGLRRLEKLNLRGNDVSDISPLKKLSALEYLNLYANSGIQDIEPLKGLKNLHTLILAYVPVGDQVDNLAELTLLRRLNLRSTGIKDLSFMAGLTKLENLNLYGNTSISSLEMIGTLEDLETLILANVPTYGDLGFLSLSGLTKLKYLNLRESGAADIEPLSELLDLEYLNLHSNPAISTIQPIKNLHRLETLILANVPVGQEAGIIENFSNLKILNLRTTGLKDLAPIGSLMSHGALQDIPDDAFPASVDIRDNPILESDGDDYESIRPYWSNITNRQPFMLPFYAALNPPVFSQRAGYYQEDFYLELTSDFPGVEIHYTLDGSQPSLDSPRYTAPLLIANRMGESNSVSSIKDISANFRAPLHPVTKGTVVRVVAINPDTREESHVVTQTYFVGREIEKRYNLPVVSLVGDQADFFDPRSGIYVLGERYAELDEADLTEDQRQVFANFNQRGREWERSISIEIFEPAGNYFQQDGGVRVHGAGSRRSPQKSLRLYARPEYDEEMVFDYPLFSGMTGAPLEDLGAVYPTFILRNSGQDWAVSMLRDAFAQRLAEGTTLDRQAGRFAVVFLNGEYWGIYHMQERYDAAWLSNHYGIPTGQGVILGLNGELISGEPGDNAAYTEMMRFIRTHDLADQANYKKLDTMMDIDSYMDYLIFEIYAANQDWPDKNVYLWRMKTDGYQSGAPEGQDGRWRWMLIDLDFTFGLKSREGDITHDTVKHAQIPSSSGLIFSKLLKNDSFRSEFKERFYEHLATTFAPERVESVLNSTSAELYPYMDEFFDRWGTGSLGAWEEEIELMHRFAQERPQYIKELLNSAFDE